MTPEEYAAILATGKIILKRDGDGNYLFDAYRASTAVLPRDIIEQLEKQQKEMIIDHEARLTAFDRFITDLRNAR